MTRDNRDVIFKVFDRSDSIPNNLILVVKETLVISGNDDMKRCKMEFWV